MGQMEAVLTAWKQRHIQVYQAKQKKTSCLSLDQEKTYKCLICCDSGVVFSYTDSQGNDYYKPCKCMFQRQVDKRLRFADIPNEFQDYTVDSFDVSLYQFPANLEKAEIVKKLCKEMKIDR